MLCFNLVENDEIADVKGNDPLSSSCPQPDLHSHCLWRGTHGRVQWRIEGGIRIKGRNDCLWPWLEDKCHTTLTIYQVHVSRVLQLNLKLLYCSCTFHVIKCHFKFFFVIFIFITISIVNNFIIRLPLMTIALITILVMLEIVTKISRDGENN